MEKLDVSLDNGSLCILREVIGLFVDGSNKAEPYFCFRQQIAIFRVEALS